MKATLLLIGAIIAGFLGYFQLTDPTALASMTSNLTAVVKPLWTQAQSAWATLPAPIQGAVTLGIPSAFAVFFAWTKSRAMTKLQETKVQASQQIGQLQGEASEQISQLEQEKSELTEKLASMPQTDPQLSSALNEAQTLVSQQRQELTSKTATINDLHGVIKDLKMQVVTKTVVK